MSEFGRRWSVHDRQGHPIYLTHERWAHVIHATNHPEMEAFEAYLKMTLMQGQRTQDPLNPQKYRYVKFFDDLPEQVNTIVAIVLFSVDVDEHGQTTPNNYVTTAYFKHIRPKR